MEKTIIYKSKFRWDKKNPYIVARGDLRASFKTRKQAENYKKTIKKMYFHPITFKIVNSALNKPVYKSIK